MPELSMRSLLVLLGAVSAAFAAKPLVIHDASFQPDIILRAERVNQTIACAHRASVAINGTIPGPLVRLREGKTTWIRVYNDMSHANLTIHWHGLSQSVAPFSDGTPLASQWPIAPLHFFDYELKPQIGEAGTYFYHSHVQFQSVTAAGPVVVEEHDSKPPYEYDEERILYMQEFFRRRDRDIVLGLQGNPFRWSGEPSTLLLNGHGPPHSKTPDTNKCGPEVIEVEPDKTYRFRFIGSSTLANIAVGIQNHAKLDIIQADASYTKPYTTDHMQLSSGQRFDVLLRTKSEAELKKAGKMDFWIQMNDQYRPTEVISYGLLRYKKRATCHNFSCYKPGHAAQPAAHYPPVPSLKHKLLDVPRYDNKWLEYALEPMKPNDFPSASEVTRRVYLKVVQVQLKNEKILWIANNHSWVDRSPGPNYRTSPDEEPYLVSIYEQGEKAIPSVKRATSHGYGGWDPEFNAYPAEIGEVIEVVLVNEAGFANTYDVHPWHAHGGHYYDIGSGPGVYDPEKNEKKLKGYSPVLRDTTMLYRYPANNVVNDTQYHESGWRAWRLRVTDPGVWMVHCHTTEHMLMGLQTVWVMGSAKQIKSRGLPPMSNFDTWGKNDVGSEANMAGYLTYRGAAYGNATHAPVVHHHFPANNER